MKKIFFFLFAFVFAYSCTPQEAPNTFKDNRDGRVYKTVTIGSQTWMAENLAYLPAVSRPTSGSETEPLYYVYGYEGTDVAAAKSHENYKKYGALYNWPAAMAEAASSIANPSGVQGICPEGWHLPSDAEWTQLETYLANNGYNYTGSIDPVSGDDVRLNIAKSIANANGWNVSSVEGASGNSDYPEYKNKSGFSALPGGCRTFMSAFSYIGSGTYWWSTSLSEGGNGYYRALFTGSANVSMSMSFKANGHSVRCVKN
ncbi:MAG: hypothetical protein GX877_04735 [Bacteroidales bacterium]|nr:hypothetical protein [Bacteroidales bacterium]